MIILRIYTLFNKELLKQCYLVHVAMIPVATQILLPDFLAKHVIHRVLARAVSIQILQHESALPFVLLLDACLALLLVLADVVGHGIPVHAVLLFRWCSTRRSLPPPTTSLLWQARQSSNEYSSRHNATLPLCHFATIRWWKMCKEWREREDNIISILSYYNIIIY